MKPEEVRILSTRKLSWLLGIPYKDLELLAENAGRCYQPFDRRRQRGTGKWRHIDNPQGIIKTIQSRIQKRILSGIEFPETMFGGIRGRSAKDHAAFHAGQSLLVTMDIKACFPSTTHKSIYEIYVKKLACAPDIARVLTKLTTFQRSLPQGAPTSLSLANLALWNLHEDLQALAKRLDLRMSMYVDDIAFSGARAREAIEPAIRLTMSHGYAISQRKVEIQPRSSRQEMVGSVVNVHPSLSSEKREKLFFRIHELAAQKNPLDQELKSVRSSIAYLKWVNPTQAACLENLAERLLPETGVGGSKSRSDETRPCNHRRVHGVKFELARA